MLAGCAKPIYTGPAPVDSAAVAGLALTAARQESTLPLESQKYYVVTSFQRHRSGTVVTVAMDHKRQYEETDSGILDMCTYSYRLDDAGRVWRNGKRC
jgi:hypothetical protein